MGIDIGSRIKDLRVVSGLTQEELADRTELSKGFISQLERDLTSPSISTLEDILRVLGVTIAEFFAEGRDEQLVFGVTEEHDGTHKADFGKGRLHVPGYSSRGGGIRICP